MKNLNNLNFNALKTQLDHLVRGQTEVVGQVVDAIERRERKTAPPRGCRGAFLNVGPTGVGKTELVLALARLVFGEGSIVRFDSSEFSQSQSLETTLSDGPKFPGRIAEAYKKVPQGIWLFDEIEKGSEAFKDLLIQITDAARLTLTSGRVLDFSEIYIFATSNLGTREILEQEHLPTASLERHVVMQLEKWLRPELLARFESPFVFRALSWETQKEITQKRIDELVAWNAQNNGFQLRYDEAVVEHLIAAGFSRRYGARPLIRTIDRLVGDAIIWNLRAGGDANGRLQVDGEFLKLIGN